MLDAISFSFTIQFSKETVLEQKDYRLYSLRGKDVFLGIFWALSTRMFFYTLLFYKILMVKEVFSGISA